MNPARAGRPVGAERVAAMSRTRAFRVAVVVSACLVAVATAIAAVMKITQTAFAMPAEGEVVQLNGLHYGINFSADINTAKFEVKSKEGEAKVLTVWTFTGSNTAGKMHRVDVTVRLVNEIGERVAAGRRMAVLSAGAKNQKFTVKVKVEAEILETVALVQVQADWTSS
jgi:hypothetical protein